MPNWSPPSISSVRAFEAAARLLSFTRAAAELNVTQSAVSHGVRDLETRLGTTLFVRDGRTLSISEAGRLYLPLAAEALSRLRAADRAVLDPQRKARVLTVSVSPSFAAKWLVPRLGVFSEEHPDLDLRISAIPQHIDFADGEIDVAIRHGNGAWPRLHCQRLCEETLFPVCSPRFFGKRTPRSLEALSRATLLHHLNADRWRAWLEAFDVSPPLGFEHGPVLSEMSLVIDAAIAGQGIGLVRSALVSRDLEEGRLVRAVPDERPAEFAYWIVCPPEHADAPKNVRFRQWLLRQAGPSTATRGSARSAKRPKSAR